MNLNSNASKAIAVLVLLNAGIFAAHHKPMAGIHTPVVRAQVMEARGTACKARAEARVAAMEARIQAREAAREAAHARVQVQVDAARAAAMAPAVISTRSHTGLTDYVRCILNSGTRSVNGGI